MKAQKSRIGMALAAIYILLVLIVAIVVYTTAQSQPAGSEFMGVYLLLVTLPWSILIYTLFDFMGMKVTTRIDIVLLIFFTITNALMLYIIGTKWSKPGRKVK